MAKERDVGTAIAIGAGGLALGAGLFLFLSGRAKGVDPSDNVPVKFVFKYLGPGGTFVLGLRFGKPFPVIGFVGERSMGDHELEIELLEPDVYEVPWIITLPDGAKPGNYDAEATILTPEMELGKDFIIRVFQKSAINVRKQ